MKMEQTECSETSAYKIQTPGNYPKESIQYKVPVHTTKTHRRTGGTAPLIRNLGTRWTLSG